MSVNASAFTGSLSKTQVLANGSDLSTLSLKSGKVGRKIYFHVLPGVLNLSSRQVTFNALGRASINVSANFVGSHKIWIVNHAVNKSRNQAPASGILQTLTLAAANPLALGLASSIYGGTCIPLNISGGLPPYSASFSGSNFYVSSDSRIQNGNEFCTNAYEPGSATIRVSDSSGQMTSSIVQVVPVVKLFNNPLIKGECARLSGSGGVPRMSAPFYDFYQILADNSRVALADQQFCPTDLGLYTLEIQDSENHTSRKTFEAVEPLVITTTILRQGCNRITASGGKKLPSAPFYSFSQIDLSGQMITLENGVFCDDTSPVGTQIVIRAVDTLGMNTSKTFILFSPPPKPISVEVNDSYYLKPGECTNFTIVGNLGMAYFGLVDTSGGTANVFDDNAFDDSISGSYCAGPESGEAKLSFKDNDNAEIFVLSLFIEKPVL